MREDGLKRWQRVLIVLSIFWMAFGSVWGWRHANDRVDAEFKQCLTQIKKAADVQACRAQRAQALVPQWFGAAVAATLPVGLFWLGLYTLIFLARRTKRAFAPEPEVARASAPPGKVLKEEPRIAGPAPAALASGPVAIGPQARPSLVAPEACKSANKRTVEKYMEATGRSDYEGVLSCLTDDVEWLMPGQFRVRSKGDFDRELKNGIFASSPAIMMNRLTEEGDVVVAEGKVWATRGDGRTLNADFCDVFEMRNGKIRRVVSYVVEVKDS